jgi:hypothetical protein
LEPALEQQLSRLRANSIEDLAEALLGFNDSEDLHRWLAEVGNGKGQS